MSCKTLFGLKALQGRLLVASGAEGCEREGPDLCRTAARGPRSAGPGPVFTTGLASEMADTPGGWGAHSQGRWEMGKHRRWGTPALGWAWESGHGANHLGSNPSSATSQPGDLGQVLGASEP